MPEYVFTGPDGAKYYASGDNPDAAFPSARPISDKEIEGLRASREAATPGGQMERELARGADIRAESERYFEQNKLPLATGIAESAIPGLSVARHVKAGEYGEAAEDAAYLGAAAAVPFVPKSVLKTAGAAGGLAFGLGGKSIAEDDPLGFIKDKQAHDAAAAQIAKIRGEDRVDTSRLRQDAITALRKEYQGRADAEAERVRKLAAEGKAAEDFNKRNADMIASLTDDQRNQLANRVVPGDVLATLRNQGEYLDTVAKQRERSKMGFAQRHEDEMEWIQKGAYGASFLIPPAVLGSKASTLRKSAQEAEAAYNAAIGAKGAARQPAEDVLTLRGSQLAKADQSKGMGWGALALAPTIPLAAAEAPNLIDLATLQNHPESEAYQHAWKAVNPWADPNVPWSESPAAKIGVRGLTEGAQATAAGLAVGEPISLAMRGHAGRNAGGTLEAIQKREAAAARAAAEKETEKSRKAAAAEWERVNKRATSEAAIAEREKSAYERGLADARAEKAGEVERVSGADVGKRAYAESAAQREAEMADRQGELARAMQQSQAKRKRDPLKAGGPLAADDDVLAAQPKDPLAK